MAFYHQVKYKEKYEKERGKPMLDFETPTYITAKESQQMQSGVSQKNTTTQQRSITLLNTSSAHDIASFLLSKSGS